MNTEELVGISAWIDEEIINRRIPQIYSELAGLLQNNANGSPQAFGTLKDQLVSELEEVDLASLSDDQRDFIEKLNLLDHIGEDGAGKLQDILYRNSLDIATASSSVAKISSEVQSGVDRSNQIKAALSGLIDVYEDPSDEVLIRVSFDGAASIDNIVDLKKWAGIWHDIGRGVAIAVGDTPKDIRVVGAQKGSIIVVLATTYGIAKVVTFILLKALEVAEKSLSLRKTLLEIESLKLNNHILEEQIKITAADERKLGLENISKELNDSIDKIDGEKVAALEKSVAKLLDFLEKGGQVDVVLPLEVEDEADDEDELTLSRVQAQKLRHDVHRIRELEADMRRIPHLPR